DLSVEVGPGGYTVAARAGRGRAARGADRLRALSGAGSLLAPDHDARRAVRDPRPVRLQAIEPRPPGRCPRGRLGDVCARPDGSLVPAGRRAGRDPDHLGRGPALGATVPTGRAVALRLRIRLLRAARLDPLG